MDNTPTLTLAGKGDRLANLIIDMITFFLIWIILSIILILVGFDQTYTDETGELIPLIPMIIVIPTFWGYYIILEYFFQKTLGKVLTKTTVISKTGSKPTLGKIIGRTISRSIPFEYFSYLVTVNGIHDSLSGTRVIKQPPKNPNTDLSTRSQ
jgi:uncharacterized RDD family membrane protein YckC